MISSLCVKLSGIHLYITLSPKKTEWKHIQKKDWVLTHSSQLQTLLPFTSKIYWLPLTLRGSIDSQKSESYLQESFLHFSPQKFTIGAAILHRWHPSFSSLACILKDISCLHRVTVSQYKCACFKSVPFLSHFPGGLNKQPSCISNISSLHKDNNIRLCILPSNNRYPGILQ